jgi:hypothetical protein
MPSIFSPEREAEVRQRMSRLSPDAPAQFGKMRAPQMVCHLIDAYRNTLGDNPTAPIRGPLNNALVRWLVIYVMPWPKGKVQTAPSFLATQPATWAADIARWNELLTRIVSRSHEPSPRWDTHPAFGDLPTRHWGALLYRHTDHHLKQFGV